jgi:hypothetical protein
MGTPFTFPLRGRTKRTLADRNLSPLWPLGPHPVHSPPRDVGLQGSSTHLEYRDHARPDRPTQRRGLLPYPRGGYGLRGAHDLLLSLGIRDVPSLLRFKATSFYPRASSLSV